MHVSYFLFHLNINISGEYHVTNRGNKRHLWLVKTMLLYDGFSME